MALFAVAGISTSLQGFHLDTPEDMWVAVQWLAQHDYAAHVNYAEANQSWSLWLSKGSMNASAVLTDWVILENGAVVRGVVSAADFPVLYQVQ